LDALLPDVIDLNSCLLGALYRVVGYDICAFLQPAKRVCAAHSCVVRTRFDTMHSGLVDNLDCMLAAVLGLHDHGFGPRIQLGNRSVNSSDDVLCGPDQSTQKEKRTGYTNSVLVFHFRLPKTLIGICFLNREPQYGSSACSKTRRISSIADHNMAT